MSDFWALAALILTCLTLFSGLLGLVVRYALIPYLREHLQLQRETHHQVTANSHASVMPTVMDRLDDIAKALTNTNDNLAATRNAVIATNERLDEHLSWSEDETAKIWKALLIRAIGGRNPHDG